MSALQIKEDNIIMSKMQSIKGQIIDIEILTKTKYDSDTPLTVGNKVQQLKQNIFDLDISLSNKIVE